jgi:hypothetical protein
MFTGCAITDELSLSADRASSNEPLKQQEKQAKLSRTTRELILFIAFEFYLRILTM